MQRIRRLSTAAILLLIVTVCLSIWYIRMDAAQEVVVHSDTPEWHLHDYDFDRVFVRARGVTAEYVPNQLLTPQAFDKADYLTGRPQGSADYLTARFRLFVPDGRVYALTTDSVDFADSIYINGQLYQEIGHPASTKAEMIPQTRAVLYGHPRKRRDRNRAPGVDICPSGGRQSGGHSRWLP